MTSESCRKAYYAKLRAEGRCTKCRGPLDPERAGKTTCSACAAKESVRYREWYQTLKGRGICTRCAKHPAMKGKTTCLACGVRMSEMYYRKIINNRKGEEHV